MKDILFNIKYFYSMLNSQSQLLNSGIISIDY